MKASEVYLRAAEIVDANGGCSCIAVSEAVCGIRYGAEGYQWDCPQRHAYAEMFDLDPMRYMPELAKLDDRQQFRVLALLLMSEIAKDEERSA